MDQSNLDQLIKQANELSKEQIIEVLSFVDEKIKNNDTMLMEMSNPRLMANFHAFAQISLSLLKEESTGEIGEWVKEACYGLDSDSRRELQSD